jgi:hypothetical protein
VRLFAKLAYFMLIAGHQAIGKVKIDTTLRSVLIIGATFTREETV